MRSKTDSPNVHDVRMRLFSVLQESNLSMIQAAMVLAQCHRYIQERAAIERIARESGLQLDGFLADEDLELYYDIAKDGHDVGFISKGWDDPGFRIGELLILPAENSETFRKYAPEIMDFCSSNGVVCTGRITPDGLELSLLDNIYSEGFNTATFLQTLESVHYCTAKVRAILRGE
jgi:hypothetical protein